MKLFLSLFLLFMLSGCVKLETEYTHTDDSGTTKITIKKDNGKNLTIKYVLINKRYSTGAMLILKSNECEEYFDEGNWICRGAQIAEMKDGKLTIYTDGKAQVFTSEKKLRFK